ETATVPRDPEICQAGRNHRSQIPRTINADLHHSSDGEIACCPIFYLRRRTRVGQSTGGTCPARKRTGNGQGGYGSLGVSAPISASSGKTIVKWNDSRIQSEMLGEQPTEHLIANLYPSV